MLATDGLFDNVFDSEVNNAKHSGTFEQNMQRTNERSPASRVARRHPLQRPPL